MIYDRPIYVLDADGVLLNFLEPCLDIINRWMTRLIRHDDNHALVTEYQFSDDTLTGWHPHPERWSESKKLEHMTSWHIFDSLGVPKEVVDEVYREMMLEGWCEKLQPLPGAAEGVKLLKSHGDVYVCTSPMNGPTWTHERERSLATHFDISPKNVIHARSKFLMFGDVFVDDKPAHVLDWCQVHNQSYGVLYKYVANNGWTGGLPVNAVHTSDWEMIADLGETAFEERIHGWTF